MEKDLILIIFRLIESFCQLLVTEAGYRLSDTIQRLFHRTGRFLPC